MSDYRQAKVYVSDVYAGILKETESGYEFSYNEDYLARENALPVSLTLPLTAKVYESGILFPFFDGIIPEGWLLEQVSKNWKIPVKDRFGLLLVSCADAIGNVSIKGLEDVD